MADSTDLMTSPLALKGSVPAFAQGFGGQAEANGLMGWLCLFLPPRPGWQYVLKYLIINRNYDLSSVRILEDGTD